MTLNNNNEDGERTVFKITSDLIKEAKQKGVSPCDICNHDQNKCGGQNCYAWYVWFSEKWQDIKEAARRRGYNV